MTRGRDERWIRGADREGTRRTIPFDPVIEGARHGLSRELSLALWKLVREEVSTEPDKVDIERAKTRFLELAAQLAAGGAKLRPDVGRLTRVALGPDGVPTPRSALDALRSHVPGRETQVIVEARRWASREPQMEAATQADQIGQPASMVAATRPGLPGADAVASALAGLSLTAPPRPEVLDSAVASRMSQMFGVDLSRVRITTNSPAATGATKAVTKDGQVHFRAGAYRPGTRDGDWLIAHELAHVVQQGATGARAGSTKEIEREADRAASLAVRGRTAAIGLRAQPAAAYAFSDSESHEDVDVDDAQAHAGAHQEGHVAGDSKQAESASGKAPASPGHDAGNDRAQQDHGGEADSAGNDSASLAEVSAVLPADAAAPAPAIGGGGGGAKPNKEPPSIAAATPEAGLAQLRGVRPDRLSQLFGQVRTATGADVSKQRAELRAHPAKQMSTGAPATAPKTGAAKDGVPTTANAAAGTTPAAHDAKTAAGATTHPIKPEAPEAEATKQAKQAEATAQREAVNQVVESTRRSIQSWFNVSFDQPHHTAEDDKTPKLSATETRELAGSVDKLPTTAADISTDAGASPEVAMKAQAQTRADKDRADLEKTVAAHETLSRADSRAPMGEDHIEPNAAPEELTAALAPSATAAGPVALPTVAGAATSEEVGIVAQEQHGTEIDAALARGSADVTAERGKHDAEEARARAESDTQIRDLKSKADADQAAARATAQADVAAARGQWQAEIDQQGADARRKGDQKVAEGMAQVTAEEAKANAEAKKHVDEGKQKAEEEKKKGEREAADAKDKGKQKSSGFWGWVSSKAKAAVAGIKKAVSAAIDVARRAAKAVIAAAKKLAMAVIDAARKVITSLIKLVGDALIAISSVLLAAFPALRAKFQGLIHKAVDKAVNLVNKLADGLKKAVQKALDLLGAALDKALSLLEKGINAIVDAVGTLVQGAIKAAQALVEMLGTWAKLIKDVATGPGSWIKKLGAAIMDGLKNHLWTALKTAVVEWFKSKVFELLGIGGIILELLLEGGLTRDHIVQMALDALMVAIPAALIAILLEKLVSMIVPAAGAVMAIIEGLQAAWGTISRIIAAFSAFVGFLLAIKSGSAGPLFAGLLAAAAVVVLDFVSNWLLKKLASAARKVGAKLRGLAEKFKAKRKAKKDAKAGKHETTAHADSKHPDDKKHDDKKPEDKKPEDDKKKQLADAVRALRPQIKSLIKTQPSKLQVRSRLAEWKVQYRLTDLRMNEIGDQVSFTVKVNPEADAGVKAIDPKPGTASYYRAKQNVQQRAKALVGTPESTNELKAEHKRTQQRGEPLELATSREQLLFSGVLEQGGTGGTKVRVGTGDSAGDVSLRQFASKNSIIINQHGSSQAILEKLTRGAKDIGMTEQELAAEIANFGRTGQIDRRIRGNPELMHTIRAEVLRQHSVEPARISTHLADRASATEKASSAGGKISEFETAADVAKIKDKSLGAVQGHQVVEGALDRQAQGQPPVDPRTKKDRMRETAGHRVLEVIDKEAQAMDGKLIIDVTALENALFERIRRELGL